MNYHIRKFTAFHIFWMIFAIGVSIYLKLYYFNPVMGVIFIFIMLFYVLYLFVWKLEFNTGTGEFHCRTLFYSQEFHASDIKYYGTVNFFHSGVNRQYWITIFKDGIKQNIYMPEANTKELKRYLEAREKKPWRYK